MKVYCIDGPCEGQTHDIEDNSITLIVSLLDDPIYKRAHYRITDQRINRGEYVAFYMGGDKLRWTLT